MASKLSLWPLTRWGSPKDCFIFGMIWVLSCQNKMILFAGRFHRWIFLLQVRSYIEENAVIAIGKLYAFFMTSSGASCVKWWHARDCSVSFISSWGLVACYKHNLSNLWSCGGVMLAVKWYSNRDLLEELSDFSTSLV